MTMAPTGLTELTATDLAAWVRRAGDLIAEHADELTELDAAIGDADHGANMKAWRQPWRLWRPRSPAPRTPS